MQPDTVLKSDKVKPMQMLLRIVLGSLLLAVLARISIPVGPVPVSLQTLGVLFLGMTLGSKEATLSVLLYLAEATMGLPVLAMGISKPLWMFGTTSGYLLGFVPAAYLAGMAKNTFKSALFYYSLSLSVILLSGTAVLSFMIGLNNAIAFGLMPFLIGDALKVLFAASSFSLKKKWQA